MSDLTIKMDDITIVISSYALRDLLMSGVPEPILNVDSPVRKTNWKTFGMAKQFLYGALPVMFRKMGTEMPKLPKDTDVILFATKFACEYTVQAVSNKAVEFITDKEYGENGEITYRVSDLVAIPTGQEEYATTYSEG